MPFILSLFILGLSKLNFRFADFLENFFSRVGSEIQVESSIYFGSEIQVESSLHFGSGIHVGNSIYFGSEIQVESSQYFGSETT